VESYDVGSFCRGCFSTAMRYFQRLMPANRAPRATRPAPAPPSTAPSELDDDIMATHVFPLRVDPAGQLLHWFAAAPLHVAHVVSQGLQTMFPATEHGVSMNWFPAQVPHGMQAPLAM